MNIKNKEQWEEKFLYACMESDLKNIRYLCQKQYLNLGWADIHANDEKGFRWACRNGHLEVIQYLLTSPELIEAGHSFADLHAWAEKGFQLACYGGHLEIVKYLLTSKELIEAGHTLANLHAEDDLGFRWACLRGNLELMKYLLTSPELKEAGHSFADVHAQEDDGFCRACENEHWDVVRWLVMDYGIEKTRKIEKIIKKHPQAKEYFRVREELKEIQKTMLIKNAPNNKSNDNDGRMAKKAKKL